MKTFCDILVAHAEKNPENTAFTFLVSGVAKEAPLTVGELHLQAMAVASQLRRHHGTNERAILLFPSGLEFIIAFMGCLYEGTIAVPTYPPDLGQMHSLIRLKNIVQNARPKIILTTGEIQNLFQGFKEQAMQMIPELQGVEWITVDRHAKVDAAWTAGKISLGTIAFLQYTSGSTSKPRGVIITHENLVSNQKMIEQKFEHSRESMMGGWLPLYHDMGLIGMILQPLFVGFPSIFMSPWDFLKKPLRWLEAISKYHITTSGAPNFAYDLCVRKIASEQKQNLDLKSWTIAFNGAEPIHHETLTRFAQTFASNGFRDTSFYPCYGLAESTLLVAGTKKGAKPKFLHVDKEALAAHRVAESASGTTLVSVGTKSPGMTIQIMNPDSSAPCPPNCVGEICLQGPNMSKGYFGPLTPSHQGRGDILGEGGFFKTGDLGFMKDGELYITGRLKDLIIIYGQNHYPQDIERTVEKVDPVIRPGCVAAFAIDEESKESLALAIELRENNLSTDELDALIRKIKKAVNQEHEIKVCALALIREKTLPKTSSGKLQRGLCKKMFLNKQLDLTHPIHWSKHNHDA